MRISSLIRGAAIASVAALTLTGCSLATPAAPGDKEACEVYAVAQSAFLQTSAAVAKIAEDPANVTEEVIAEFESKKQALLDAYDTALATVESADLKAALQSAQTLDTELYNNMATATDAQIQESMAAAAALVTNCTVSGVDIQKLING
ncbi:MAG: hypothetical protein ACKOWP_01165 [Microbacteriaceae bacterium]